MKSDRSGARMEFYYVWSFFRGGAKAAMLTNGYERRSVDVFSGESKLTLQYGYGRFPYEEWGTVGDYCA